MDAARAALMAAFLPLAAVAAVAAGTAGTAVAETPRSAIPWLSQSLVATPGRTEVAPVTPLALPTADPDAGPAAEIETTPLGTPSRDGVGLLSSDQTGLPADLWGRASALRVRSLLTAHKTAGVPAARALFHAILLAEFQPPPGASSRNTLLLARIDRLLAEGQLEQAEALVQRAGITDPEIFRRAFDIGLLTERSATVCETLAQSPALSPTLPARIFCLARTGDWNAAALTLQLGYGTGQIDAAQEALLARFLDPDIFEDAPAPPPPEPLTTLDFMLRDAVALPRPPGPLPLAFLHFDLADHAPMRARIMAGERLARAGAIPGPVLFAAYRAGRPAASGGVWDHAQAVQTLDRALASGTRREVAVALTRADDLFARLGLRLALAQDAAPALAALDPAGLPPEARHRAYALLMLAEDRRAARRFMADNNDVTDRFLRALAEPGSTFPDTPALSPMKLAAARGLTRPDPPRETARVLVARLADGATGEVLLATLDLLAAGPEVDPGDLETALYVLRRAGLTDWARRIATQTLLLLPDA